MEPNTKSQPETLKNELVLNKCSGHINSEHEGKVFGLCQKCGEQVCTKCCTTRHYDHISTFYSYDMESAYLANYVTRLKTTTQKALTTRNKLLPILKFENTVDSLISNTQLQYNGFKEMLQKSCEENMNLVRGSTIVKRLKSQHENLTKGRIRQMEELRKKLNECKEKLIQSTIKAKYYETLQIIEETKKYKSELDGLIDAQQRETDIFYSQIRRFKDIYIGIDIKSLDDICKIENLDKLDAKLYKICSKNEILISLAASSKKLTEIHFQDYKPPYNAAVLEILGDAYIIGGSNTELKSNKEASYSNKTIVVDLDSGELVQKDSMRERRMCFGTAVFNNQFIFVVGGFNHTKCLSGCEKYDIHKNQWAAIPKLNNQKSNIGVCTFNEFIYTFGGFLNDDHEDDFIERLSINEPKQWEFVGKLYKKIQNPGVIQISPKEILIFGGLCEENQLDLSRKYVVETGEFKEIESMKHGDTMLGCKPRLFQVIFSN